MGAIDYETLPVSEMIPTQYFRWIWIAINDLIDWLFLEDDEMAE